MSYLARLHLTPQGTGNAFVAALSLRVADDNSFGIVESLNLEEASRTTALIQSGNKIDDSCELFINQSMKNFYRGGILVPDEA
jgi:hypothetical protein